MQSYYREEGTSITFLPVGGCRVTAGAHDLTGWISWRLQTLALPLISHNNMSKSSSAQLGWMGLVLFSMKHTTSRQDWNLRRTLIWIQGHIYNYHSWSYFISEQWKLIIKLIIMGHYAYAVKKWETYFDMTWRALSRLGTKVCLVKWCDKLSERQDNICFACTDLQRSRF